MQSIQIYTVKTFINIFRSVLFVHKTEPNTVRVGFERLSNITKFPRFVKKEELKYAGSDAAWFIPDGFGNPRLFYTCTAVVMLLGLIILIAH
jgi:hypothetical protein